MKILTRLGHAIVALLFLAMAAVQLNDPDPIYWIATYTLVSAVALFHSFGRKPKNLIIVTAGMVLAGLLISAPGFIEFLATGDFSAIGGQMSAEKPYIESGREFLGLLIGGIVLAYYLRRSRA